jgi:hypothetical protein
VLPLGVIALVVFLNLSGDRHPGSAEFVGSEQTVFDWSRDACEPIDIPDASARAFRDEDGRVNMIAASYVNRRFIGPDLDHLDHPCEVLMGSELNPDPAAFGDREWITATYTRDGKTIAALVHDEYQGEQHPGRCPAGTYQLCWFNSITYAASSDGGRTFTRPPAPQRLVATVPYTYEPGAGPYGLFQPSNIVYNRKDGYYYALLHAQRFNDQQAGVCTIRTRTLSRPDSWRAWDGDSFTVAFTDPYAAPPPRPSDHVCAPVDADIRGMTQSLTYNTYFGKFMLLGTSILRPGRGGIFFSLSDDLVHWSPLRLIETVELVYTYECGDNEPIAHPAILDPASTSRNFETAGREPYMYFTRLNFDGCQQTLDRDLVRVRIRFSK